MANVHEVYIEGWMTFNIYDDEKALRWLGVMNSPSYGLRIEYGEERYVPNEHPGGQTAQYRFVISGQEAIRYDAYEALVKCLKDAGCVVDEARARDMEG